METPLSKSKELALRVVLSEQTDRIDEILSELRELGSKFAPSYVPLVIGEMSMCIRLWNREKLNSCQLFTIIDTCPAFLNGIDLALEISKIEFKDKDTNIITDLFFEFSFICSVIKATIANEMINSRIYDF